ncbi:alanine racemase [Candidatus Photodesmus katoptron]|uniref:Alanine racemase n=1 Tax=Candidatus Photodesmus katoptron Akat1 TaxID=1236703 RepID=S3E1C5_9GAMM|nr:alanine racemase [Candidatus Photodesmus katoptron]EPE37986.1 alanine racemase [Candidatus Photodesmus katoptron Akat1]KEY90228.1 alanine racemase [Candidatus Photodesmus katoptron]
MSNDKGYGIAVKAVVDLKAFQDNIALIKTQAPNSKIMAILKANAYGHGLCRIARCTNSVHAIGVARIEEALQLRESGILKPIILLEGFYSLSDLFILSANNIQTVLHCEEQLLLLEQTKLKVPIVVWLKIDTGMNRLGINPNQCFDFLVRLKSCRNIDKSLRVMSHFSCADDFNFSMKQFKLFLSLTKDCNGERSIAASGALLYLNKTYLEWVRPGIIMYGLSPFFNQRVNTLGYRPVMTLKSVLIAIRDIKYGESIGYGRTWISKCNTKVGVISIGYGDGYPRMAPNGTPVFLNGRKVPIVGRVSMDMITIDLGFNSIDKVGDEVILWGRELPAEEIARYIGTLAYELVTRITSRVEIQYM